jgi:hypothetical protein
MALDPEKIFAGLSIDPYLASYELLQRIERELSRGNPEEADYNAACGLLEGFYESNGWKPPERIDAGSYSSSDSIRDIARKTKVFQRLRYEAYVNQINANQRASMKGNAKAVLEAAMAREIGYAVLDADEKAAIHKHIEKIRELVEASGLDDRKKNNLFSRLARLTSEVNRNGTRTDRFFAFASELGFSIGQFAKDAKPAIDETKEILKIVTKARSRHEGLKLPAGEEVLSLPEPLKDSAE